jgi:hypothetical protein
MGAFDIGNPDANDPTQFYYNQGIPLPPATVSPTIITGDVTVITTINGGGGGQATGPSITLGSNWSGVNFVASAGNVNIEITNAANARAALGAAASGVNTDITQLNGASKVDVSSHYEVAGTQVVGAQQPAIPDATGGVTIDAEARAALNTLLAELRLHGLIDV